MIGFDLDGTLAEERVWLSWFDRVGYRLLGHKLWGFIRFAGVKPKWKSLPEGKFAVISCRPATMAGLTYKWLYSNGFYPSHVVLYKSDCYSKEAFADFKAEWIDKLGITVYYENDCEIVKLLEKKVKSARIVWTERSI